MWYWVKFEVFEEEVWKKKDVIVDCFKYGYEGNYGCFWVNKLSERIFE